MYRMVKSWDNRRETRSLRLPTINRRTWTRRVRWLEDADVESGTIKLKFEDNALYFETGVAAYLAQTVWDRFKAGQSIQEAVSILGCKVTLSKKGASNA